MQLRASVSPSCTRARADVRVRVSRVRSVVVRAADDGNDFMTKIKVFAKKVQGALPIVGLVSRLTSPAGGFDELSYPEFTRMQFEKAHQPFRVAMVDFEKKYGKLACSRWVLLILWMVTQGTGLVAPRDIINAARRMRVTQDIEIEIERFEGAKIVAIKKYDMMARPEGTAEDKVTLAVDALCTLCIGLKDGVLVSADDAATLSALITDIFPEASEALVKSVIDGRRERAAAYVNVR